MLGTQRSWLGRALAAGLVTATTMATPIAIGAEPGGIAEPDDFTVAEDSVLQNENYFDVLANDLSGTAITEYTQGTKGTVGQVLINGAIVKLTYTPNSNAFGTDAFTYTVTQGETTETETVSVTITPSQDNPVATNDELPLPLAAEIVENDEPIDILANVLANDVDVDEDTFTILSVDAAGAAGTVVFTPAAELDPAVLTYEPTSDTATTDSFTYVIVDSENNESAPATVTITITAVDDAPVAADDGTPEAPFAAVDEDDSVFLSVLANDVDLDGEVVVIDADSITEPTNLPANGSVELSFDGTTIYYTHDGSDTLTDSFTYGVVGGNTATVYLTINPLDDAPVAEDDGTAGAPFATVLEGDSIILDVLANDTNPDGGDLAVAAITNVPTDHSATVIADGSADDGKIEYTHGGSDLADISFTYELNGGSTANVFLAVTNTDDDPIVVENVSIDLVEDDDATPIAVLTEGQKDGDGDALVLSAIGSDGVNEDGVNPTKGSAQLIDEGGVMTLVYTPDSDENGSDSFTVEVSDGTTGDEVTVTITVNIAPVNDAPVAAGDNYTNTSQNEANASEEPRVLVLEDAVTVLPVLLNDSDVDLDALSVDLDSIELASNIGTLTAHVDGLQFTPAENYFGSFSFTYQAMETGTEPALSSDAVTVNVTVVAQPDSVTAGDDVAEVREDSVVYVSVLDNDNNPDGFGLRIVSVGQPDNGFTAIAGNRIRVEADPDFNGELEYTYVIEPLSVIGYNDSGVSEVECGLCERTTATVTVTVTPVNDRPDANSDNGITTDEDEPVSIDVLDNDTDIDGDELSIWFVGAASLGTTEIVNGMVLYTPNANVFGTDSFVYYAYDGKALSVASVNLTIAPVADAPTIESVETSGSEDNDVVVELTVDDVDPDNTALTISVAGVTLPGSDAKGTVTIDGTTLTFSPPANWVGTALISLVVTDDDELVGEGLVSIEITPVNDAPVIDDAEATTDEDEAVSIPMTFSDRRNPHHRNRHRSDPRNRRNQWQQRHLHPRRQLQRRRHLHGHHHRHRRSLSRGNRRRHHQPRERRTTTCASVTGETGKPIVIRAASCGADIDGDVLSVLAGSATATKGSASKTAAQAVTYIATAGYIGPDTVSLTLTDGKGGTVAVSVAVNVTAVVNPYAGSTGINGQVVRIYSAMLGRLPDAGGFAYWAGQRESGMTLARMIEMFADSVEFRTTFGNRIIEDTDEEWVDFVYGELMNRTPDAGGRVFWLDMLSNGRITRSSMVVVFAESAEYQRLTKTS